MWKVVRITVLLLVLLIVAGQALDDRLSTTSWQRTIYAGAFPVAADDSPVTAQYLAQLDPDIREAVLGNVGTTITFRLGAHDAAYMAREFAPDLKPIDFINLPNHEIYIRLMIDGTPSRPFSAKTLPLH